MNSFAPSFLVFLGLHLCFGGFGMEILPRTDRDGGEERKNSAELECQLDQMEKRDNRFRTIIGRSIGRKVVSHLRGPGRWLEVHSLPGQGHGGTAVEKGSQEFQEEAVHRMNTWATPTPVTDGNKVVAFFGPAGLHCFDLEGKKLWTPTWVISGSWGVAASPVIVDGLVLQNCDSMGPSRLVALDLNSGKIAWETKRETKPAEVGAHHRDIRPRREANRAERRVRGTGLFASRWKRTLVLPKLQRTRLTRSFLRRQTDLRGQRKTG